AGARDRARSTSSPTSSARRTMASNHTLPPTWIAERMRSIELSGVRKVMELARTLKDPVNLSIGQPHFDVPEPIKAAAKAAIDRGANGYTVTQGIAELRDRIKVDLDAKYRQPDRAAMVTSGTS